MNSVVKNYILFIWLFCCYYIEHLSAHAIEKEKLLLYYPCDEGSETYVRDARGNKRDDEWRAGVAKRDDGKCALKESLVSPWNLREPSVSFTKQNQNLRWMRH